MCFQYSFNFFNDLLLFNCFILFFEAFTRKSHVILMSNATCKPEKFDGEKSGWHEHYSEIEKLSNLPYFLKKYSFNRK
jgi:hypothetical protein